MQIVEEKEFMNKKGSKNYLVEEARQGKQKPMKPLRQDTKPRQRTWT